MKTIITLFLLISVYSNADDLVLGQYTHHASKYYNNPCYNEAKENCTLSINDVHPLIGIHKDGYTAFVMKNSFNRTSVGLLKTYDIDLSSNIRPYVAAGFVSGYEDALPIEWKGIAPVVYTGLDIHPSSDKWGIVISFVPQQFVGIGFRFKVSN